MNQMAHPGKREQMELPLNQSGPVKDLSFYLGICDEYQRFHRNWPRYDSPLDAFVEARIEGYDGRKLDQELRNPNPDLEADPAFQALKERCARDGSWHVDLSCLHPQYRNAMEAAEIKEMFDTITLSGRTDLQRSRIESSAKRSENQIWVNVDGTIKDEALELAGFNPKDQNVRMNSYHINVDATKNLRAYIDRIGMIYSSSGPDIGDTYYLELMDNNSLYVKYQTILGSRFAGKVNRPEFVETLAKVYAADPHLAKYRSAATATQENRTVLGSAQTAHSSASTLIAPADSELIAQLGKLVAQGQSLILPAERLSRYADIKRALEKAGGKYRQNKQQFDFEKGIDPSSVLQRLIDGDKVNFKQQYQFFATSRELSRQVCLDAGPIEGKRILEPSAGDGAIADVAREMGASEVVTVELWNVNAEKLRARGFSPIERDFLTVTPDELGLFDAVVANPPFTKGQDIDHFMHMCGFLKPGGNMSVIMSKSWLDSEQSKHLAFREFLQTQDFKLTPIEAGAFSESGTPVPTVRVTVRDFKPTLEATAETKVRHRLT